jgi:hypothetical protein
VLKCRAANSSEERRSSRSAVIAAHRPLMIQLSKPPLELWIRPPYPVDHLLRPVKIFPLSLDGSILRRRRKLIDVEGLAPRSTVQGTGRQALPVLLVQLFAVVTQAIAAVAGKSLILWNVAARRTCTVVVVHTIGKWFLYFVNRMKCWRSWHRSLPIVVIAMAGLPASCRRAPPVLYKANAS